MAPMNRRDRRALQGEVARLERSSRRRSNGRDFPLGARWNDAGTDVDYLYRNHQLICDAADIAEVVETFERLGLAAPTVTDGPVGLSVLDLGDRDAADVCEQLLTVLPHDTVTLNHVLDAQGYSSMCPATEPIPWHGPVPELADPVGPGHARVAVVDTGYLPAIAEQSGFGRFAAVTQYETDDEVYDEGVILPYGGHGSAATAQLLAISGQSSITVRVRDCLAGGAADELTIVEDLERVVTDGVDVIALQAGLYARQGHSPMAFNAFYRRVMRHHPETVIVAAAGNQGLDVPFWPAAYDWVTGAGALTKGGDARTGWTNFGYWVDLYAPGENVVVPFPNGTYHYLEDFSAEFTNGHALWSGTSFAAPVVAGMIVRRMVERGVDAPTARDIVLAEAAIAALPTTGSRLIP